MNVKGGGRGTVISPQEAHDAKASMPTSRPVPAVLQELVWLVAACPAALGLAAALRLMQLLSKKQLAHACLQLGVVLTELQDNGVVDICLFAAVLAYFLLILVLVSADTSTMLVALSALGGSVWTVLKALSAARDTR